MDTGVVVIPLERYNDLLRLETRVNVLVGLMYHHEYVSDEDVLDILGTDLSAELAGEIRMKDRMGILGKAGLERNEN